MGVDFLPLRFEYPLALLTLLTLVPLAWALRYAAARRLEADAAFGGHASLRLGASPGRRRVRDVMLIGAAALLAIAVARPQWGTQDARVERRGIDVVVALDVSRSMSAADVAPSRAEASAAGLGELLTHLRGDRAGLVTFAGTAFERSPLTLDLGALDTLVQRAQQEELLVRPGSDLGGAIEASLEVLDVDDPADAQVIVLVSDGEDLGEGLEPAMAQALDQGVRVYTVVAGTEAGAEITDQIAPEMTRADRTTLAAIAETTGGELRELESLPGLAVAFRRLRQSLFDEETERAPVERFQWFLGGALLLLLLQGAVGEAARVRPPMPGRRAAVGAFGAGALLLFGCGGSAVYQHVTEGNEAHEEGRFDDALAAYGRADELSPEDPAIDYNLGNSLHELRRFEEASVATGAALAATEDPELATRIHYALGGHAIMRGELEEARAAYIETLRRTPEDQDAKANLELVLRALAPTPTPPPGDQEGPGDGPQGGGTPVPTPGGGDPQPGTPGGQPGAPQPGGTPATDPASPGGPDGAPGGEGGREAALAEARADLAEAIAEAGPEITLEEAQRILELARRANALESLRSPGGGGSVPR
ncbi:MAG: VWA domain-containing protein [Dehalococcoidia bacterium]|nr:VWA domain-containing protein [Dehalococcoidia bacterium]